jgi:hypothetical protein
MTLQRGDNPVRFVHKEGVYEGGGLRFSWKNGQSYEYNVYIGSLDPKAMQVQWCLSGRDLLNSTDKQPCSFKLGPLIIELETVIIANQHGQRLLVRLLQIFPKMLRRAFR